MKVSRRAVPRNFWRGNAQREVRRHWTNDDSLGDAGELLRQALEIAIACKLSAQLGNVPVKLPLEDRSLTSYPSPYRWLGGDATGRPQPTAEAAGKE